MIAAVVPLRRATSDTAQISRQAVVKGPWQCPDRISDLFYPPAARGQGWQGRGR